MAVTKELGVKNRLLKLVWLPIAYLGLSIGLILIIRLVITYLNLKPNVGFLSFKQDYINIPIWKVSFYIHVFSSSLCLLAGLTQFSETILKDFAKVHKWIGKIYVYNILVINFPTGMVLAFYANGLWPTKLAFVILDLLWFWFTLKSILDVKSGNIQGHKNNMMKSFALTFSAVTLRIWNEVLSATTNIDPLSLYQINSWLGFLPNLIVVELYMRLSSASNRKKNIYFINHFIND